MNVFVFDSFRNIGEILGLGIRKATTLEDLNISYNPLTTEDIVAVLNSILEPTSLRCLRISHVFVDEHLEKVPNFQKSGVIYNLCYNFRLFQVLNCEYQI